MACALRSSAASHGPCRGGGRSGPLVGWLRRDDRLRPRIARPRLAGWCNSGIVSAKLVPPCPAEPCSEASPLLCAPYCETSDGLAEEWDVSGKQQKATRQHPNAEAGQNGEDTAQDKEDPDRNANQPRCGVAQPSKGATKALGHLQLQALEGLPQHPFSFRHFAPSISSAASGHAPTLFPAFAGKYHLSAPTSGSEKLEFKGRPVGRPSN